MSATKAVWYVIIATFLVTVSAVALLLGGISSFDSRALLVLALGGAGLAFGGLGFFELRMINLCLRSTQA